MNPFLGHLAALFPHLFGGGGQYAAAAAMPSTPAVQPPQPTMAEHLLGAVATPQAGGLNVPAAIGDMAGGTLPHFLEWGGHPFTNANDLFASARAHGSPLSEAEFYARYPGAGEQLGYRAGASAAQHLLGQVRPSAPTGNAGNSFEALLGALRARIANNPVSVHPDMVV